MKNQFFNKILILSLVTLMVLGITGLFGCRENITASSDIQASWEDQDLIGDDGFWMPNGKQHKEGCGCNICNAIRINLEKFCLSDTVIITDTIFVTDTSTVADTVIVNDTTFVTDSIISIDTVIVTDTFVVIDTVLSIDTVIVNDIDSITIIDTVETGIVLEGKWLKFSAYEASKAFIKENYPERAGDRFSTNSTYCNYNADTPAGQAGFRFIDNGDGTYTTGGYTFEYLFGAIGFVWGAAQGQPTENTYYYSCTLQLGEDNTWILLNINLQASGAYIRDTRHD